MGSKGPPWQHRQLYDKFLFMTVLYVLIANTSAFLVIALAVDLDA